MKFILCEEAKHYFLNNKSLSNKAIILYENDFILNKTDEDLTLLSKDNIDNEDLLVEKKSYNVKYVPSNDILYNEYSSGCYEIKINHLYNLSTSNKIHSIILIGQDNKDNEFLLGLIKLDESIEISNGQTFSFETSLYFSYDCDNSNISKFNLIEDNNFNSINTNFQKTDFGLKTLNKYTLFASNIKPEHIFNIDDDYISNYKLVIDTQKHNDFSVNALVNVIANDFHLALYNESKSIIFRTFNNEIHLDSSNNFINFKIDELLLNNIDKTIEIDNKNIFDISELNDVSDLFLNVLTDLPNQKYFKIENGGENNFIVAEHKKSIHRDDNVCIFVNYTTNNKISYKKVSESEISNCNLFALNDIKNYKGKDVIKNVSIGSLYIKSSKYNCLIIDVICNSNFEILSDEDEIHHKVKTLIFNINHLNDYLEYSKTTLVPNYTKGTSQQHKNMLNVVEEINKDKNNKNIFTVPLSHFTNYSFNDIINQLSVRTNKPELINEEIKTDTVFEIVLFNDTNESKTITDLSFHNISKNKTLLSNKAVRILYNNSPDNSKKGVLNISKL